MIDISVRKRSGSGVKVLYVQLDVPFEAVINGQHLIIEMAKRRKMEGKGLILIS